MSYPSQQQREQAIALWKTHSYTESRSIRISVSVFYIQNLQALEQIYDFERGHFDWLPLDLFRKPNE